jgi:C-terminal processing protease CtpA/Prc
VTKKGPLLTFLNKRFAVLMDTLSASASEILAAALYEGKRATLYGTRTYGKGMGQIQLLRRTRRMLQITFLQLRGVSARIGDYHRHGIAPETVPDTVISEGSSLDPVNRQIFYAVKLFEPSRNSGDIVFPPKRIPSFKIAPTPRLYKVVSEDEVKLPEAQ